MTVATAAVLAGPSPATAQQAPPAGAPRSDERPACAVVNVTVIDAARGASPGQTVVWEGNRIVSVGAASETSPPAGARVIDGAGKYLVPGLWDMHAHVLWPGLDTFFPLFVANGVTGVRDMGTHFPTPVVERWRAQVKGGTRHGPRFVWAGAVLDGPRPVWPGSTAVASEADARRAVRDHKAAGADFIKVYEFIARDHYLAVIDEAKKAGLAVVGHVPQSVTAAEASDAGQRCIEHLSRVVEACTVNGEVDEGRAGDLAARFLKNRTWQCPAFAIDWTFARKEDPAFAARPETKYVPRAIVDLVQLPVPHPGEAAALRQMRRKAAVLRVVHAAGVPVLAGTDCPMSGSVPGFSLHDELGLLVAEAGFTPAQALESATLAPARFLGRTEDLGTVQPGKLADLVLVDADPLKDIGNLRKIAAVVADGKLYDRAALDAVLADAARRAAENALDTRTAEELLRDVQTGRGS